MIGGVWIQKDGKPVEIPLSNYKRGVDMSGAQKELPGTEKTAEQKGQDVKRLRDGLNGALGLPSKSTDIVRMLEGASAEDLNALVNACKAITPKVRVLGAIATELLQGGVR